MSAPPPNVPDYGQTFTKGVKYLKITKLDKDGEDFGQLLLSADNIEINYPDIGQVQYNILTTQAQDGCYLMGVIPVENTSSLNNVKDLDLNAEVLTNINDEVLDSDIIVCRAFKKLNQVIQVSREIAKRPHKLIVLKGQNAQEELNKAFKNRKYPYKIERSISNKDSRIIIINFN